MIRIRLFSYLNLVFIFKLRISRHIFNALPWLNICGHSIWTTRWKSENWLFYYEEWEVLLLSSSILIQFHHLCCFIISKYHRFFFLKTFQEFLSLCLVISQVHMLNQIYRTKPLSQLFVFYNHAKRNTKVAKISKH